MTSSVCVTRGPGAWPNRESGHTRVCRGSRAPRNRPTAGLQGVHGFVRGETLRIHARTRNRALTLDQTRFSGLQRCLA